MSTDTTGWETCPDCHHLDRTHISRHELETDPIGTWRRLWRDDSVAVRWHDHPCDARRDPASPDERNWPKAWAVFGPWGVDEVSHRDVQESSRITVAEAMMDISGYPPRCSQCGQRWWHRACGPTHAVISHQLGFTEASLELVAAQANADGHWWVRVNGQGRRVRVPAEPGARCANPMCCTCYQDHKPEDHQ